MLLCVSFCLNKPIKGAQVVSGVLCDIFLGGVEALERGLELARCHSLGAPIPAALGCSAPWWRRRRRWWRRRRHSTCWWWWWSPCSCSNNSRSRNSTSGCGRRDGCSHEHLEDDEEDLPEDLWRAVVGRDHLLRDVVLRAHVLQRIPQLLCCIRHHNAACPKFLFFFLFFLLLFFLVIFVIVFGRLRRGCCWCHANEGPQPPPHARKDPFRVPAATFCHRWCILLRRIRRIRCLRRLTRARVSAAAAAAWCFSEQQRLHLHTPALLLAAAAGCGVCIAVLAGGRDAERERGRGRLAHDAAVEVVCADAHDAAQRVVVVVRALRGVRGGRGAPAHGLDVAEGRVAAAATDIDVREVALVIALVVHNSARVHSDVEKKMWQHFTEIGEGKKKGGNLRCASRACC